MRLHDQLQSAVQRYVLWTWKDLFFEANPWPSYDAIKLGRTTSSGRGKHDKQFLGRDEVANRGCQEGQKPPGNRDKVWPVLNLSKQAQADTAHQSIRMSQPSRPSKLWNTRQAVRGWPYKKVLIDLIVARQWYCFSFECSGERGVKWKLCFRCDGTCTRKGTMR